MATHSEHTEELETIVNKLIEEVKELLGGVIEATKASDHRAKLQKADWTKRHRLHVLIEAAEKTHKSLHKSVAAPWFLAELRATLDVVRRWHQSPYWASIEKSLKDPESFAHTIAMLHVAEHLEWSGHKVQIVEEGSQPSPDLMLRAIGGSQDAVLIECYQPTVLCGKPLELTPREAKSIVEKSMKKARRQIGSDLPGIIAICGYNQSSKSLKVLKEYAENRLSITDRINLCGIWLIMLGVMFSSEAGGVSFRATRSAEFIRNPAYFGRVDIEAKVPTEHPNLITSQLTDISTDALASGIIEPTLTNVESTSTKGAKVSVTKAIDLKVVQKPEATSRSIVRGKGAKVPPLFVGEGNIDYLCGRCEVVLAKNIWKLSLSNLIVQCPACESYNEIPKLPSLDYPTVLVTKGNYCFSDAVRLKAGRCLIGE